MNIAKSSVTPMMAQYLDIKQAHHDALLFYRMGDFYEMFFEDAIAAAQALDIALTKRGKHLGEDIPMCGVPVHAAESYFLTLIRKGFRVAVCEQMESPAEAKKRGSKSVVKREVVRLVTPGTLTEDSLLNARSNNFLAALATLRGDLALAWVDISTGAFHVQPIDAATIAQEIARLGPREILVSETTEGDWAETVSQMGASLTPVPRAFFDSASAEKRIAQLFDVSTTDAFGPFGRAEKAAMKAIIDYLELTQKGKLPLLKRPARESSARVMQIDAATRRNLELTTTLSGKRDGSLIATIDRTLSAPGARLLERRLSSPSCVLDEIQARLAAVRLATNDQKLRDDLRAALRKTPDMDRALSRLGLDRGGPRDLTAIRGGIEQGERIAALLQGRDLPPLLAEAACDLTGHADLRALLDAALVDDPPILTRDGGFIRPGFDTDLDEARTLRDEGRGVIAALQTEYCAATDISSLKIKHNNVLGYFIETTATHADRMLSPPLSDTFIHRQTTANAIRFTTVKLSELETRILNAGSRALETEKRLYSTLKQAVLDVSARLSDTAAALAEIDVACALADLAIEQNWREPVVDDSRAFSIEAGRHPVVEATLHQRADTPFVPNDCDLTAQGQAAAIWLLTGPNMAGKSTFLRQNALIALLAQAGSFVPAANAHIGLVSKLFSRVGASDDLAQGRSTFMVEMVETATILNQADDRSLVILDEIGRGTATYDGLSIAWATMEHLHDQNRCRALFATHYHEMTALSARLNGLDNATMTVREWEGEVIFLHEVKRGAADRSYGVQVAKLAGLPPSVVARARDVLKRLEAGDRQTGQARAALDDLPLFSQAAVQDPPAETSPAEDILNQITPDDLSPREALELIYQLKAALAK